MRKSSDTMLAEPWSGDDITSLSDLLNGVRKTFLATYGDVYVENAHLELVNRNGYFVGVIDYDAGDNNLLFSPAVKAEAL